MLKRIASYRPSPAMLVALIALFVALGGTSIAALKLKAHSVGTKQLKNDAVTGKKADESSFDIVPKARDSLNADNADSLGGFSDADFVLGSGSQFAFAGTLGNNQKDGLSFRDGTNQLIVNCKVTGSLTDPTLTWEADRDDSGSPPTDIFGGNPPHVAVTDHAPSPTVIDNNLTDGSHDIEVWTGDDLVYSARIGFSHDGSGCLLSVVANVEPNANGSTSSGDRQQASGRPQLKRAY